MFCLGCFESPAPIAGSQSRHALEGKIELAKAQKSTSLGDVNDFGVASQQALLRPFNALYFDGVFWIPLVLCIHRLDVCSVKRRIQPLPYQLVLESTKLRTRTDDLAHAARFTVLTVPKKRDRPDTTPASRNTLLKFFAAFHRQQRNQYNQSRFSRMSPVLVTIGVGIIYLTNAQRYAMLTA